MGYSRNVGFVFKIIMARLSSLVRDFYQTSNSKIRSLCESALTKTTNGQIMATTDRTKNLQDTFLNYIRKQKTPVTIFLVNGIKLQGVVTWFDNFCVLLRRDGQSQLVYKHAISTIMPGQQIQLFDKLENDDE